MCGEKWAKDHQCKPTVQLHVVQELIEQLEESTQFDCFASETSYTSRAMSISTAAIGATISVQTMQLPMIFREQSLFFLIDSGSTHSFLDIALVPVLQGVTSVPPTMVKVAGGTTLSCQLHLTGVQWSHQ